MDSMLWIFPDGCSSGNDDNDGNVANPSERSEFHELLLRTLLGALCINVCQLCASSLYVVRLSNWLTWRFESLKCTKNSWTAANSPTFDLIARSDHSLHVPWWCALYSECVHLCLRIPHYATASDRTSTRRLTDSLMLPVGNGRNGEKYAQLKEVQR